MQFGPLNSALDTWTQTASKNKQNAVSPQTYLKVRKSRGPDSDRSDAPKISVSDRLQILIDFLIKSVHFGAVLSSGKGGAHEAGFRTRPARTAGKAGKTDREATPKRHQRNNDDDHA